MPDQLRDGADFERLLNKKSGLGVTDTRIAIPRLDVKFAEVADIKVCKSRSIRDLGTQVVASKLEEGSFGLWRATLAEI